jgi:hypothetical protein
MFLSAYHFAGDPAALAAAHDRLYRQFPPGSIDLHVCVLAADGITVFDACPSREVFEEFSRSAEFRQALAGAGLPPPRLTPIGVVHDVRMRDGVAS